VNPDPSAGPGRPPDERDPALTLSAFQATWPEHRSATVGLRPRLAADRAREADRHRHQDAAPRAELDPAGWVHSGVPRYEAVGDSLGPARSGRAHRALRGDRGAGGTDGVPVGQAPAGVGQNQPRRGRRYCDHARRARPYRVSRLRRRVRRRSGTGGRRPHPTQPATVAAARGDSDGAPFGRAAAGGDRGLPRRHDRLPGRVRVRHRAVPWRGWPPAASSSPSAHRPWPRNLDRCHGAASPVAGRRGVAGAIAVALTVLGPVSTLACS
jgi:hypothetical protein